MSALLGSVTTPVSEALVDWAKARGQVTENREQKIKSKGNMQMARTAAAWGRRISFFSSEKLGFQ
jgi:hypothetical protein